eukprot:360197-Chlamydomonas_euryale.AAC.2
MGVRPASTEMAAQERLERRCQLTISHLITPFSGQQRLPHSPRLRFFSSESVHYPGRHLQHSRLTFPSTTAHPSRRRPTPKSCSDRRTSCSGRAGGRAVAAGPPAAAPAGAPAAGPLAADHAARAAAPGGPPAAAAAPLAAEIPWWHAARGRRPSPRALPSPAHH